MPRDELRDELAALLRFLRPARPAGSVADDPNDGLMARPRSLLSALADRVIGDEPAPATPAPASPAAAPTGGDAATASPASATTPAATTTPTANASDTQAPEDPANG